MGNQPCVRLQESSPRIEGRLENLLFERFIANHFGHEEIRGLGQLDVPRPARNERDDVVHAVCREHALGHFRDVAAFDRVDPPRTRSSCSNGEHAATGADIEHDVSRSHCLGKRCQVVARPAVVVQHPGVLDRIGPAARERLVGIRAHEGALIDQHVDDAHRGREVRGWRFALEPVDRLAESKRLREKRQGGVATGSEVDDSPVRRIEEDVTGRIEARSQSGRKPQERLRRQICVRRGPRGLHRDCALVPAAGR